MEALKKAIPHTGNGQKSPVAIEKNIAASKAEWRLPAAAVAAMASASAPGAMSAAMLNG